MKNLPIFYGVTALVGVWPWMDIQAGIGEGPRMAQLAPVGSQVLNLAPVHQNTSFNVDGSPSEPAARIKADLIGLQYTLVFELFDRATGIFAGTSVGEMTGKLIDTRWEDESSGVSDLVVGGVFGLIGAPAMTRAEYARYNPSLTVGLVGRLTLPVGSYDADEMFNLGSNRWAFQIGGAFSWYLGQSLLPGNVSSIELTPSVKFFGDNDDPWNGEKLEQKPLYALEANFTHDFNDRFWASLDALYVIGGRTITDGVSADGETEKFALGGSLGVYLTRGVRVQFNYGKTLKVDTDGYHDHLFRIKVAKAF